MHSHQSQRPKDSPTEIARSFERIGFIYHRKGALEEAVAALEYAVSAKPSAALWYNYGSMLDEVGRREEAVVAFQQALEMQPDLAPAYNNLGVALARLGRRRQARAAFRSLLTLDDGDAAQAFHRSAAYYNLGKTRRAVRAFVQAVAASPEMAGEFTDLHAALSQERRMESLLSQRGYHAVADSVAPHRKWFKWQIFDGALLESLRSFFRGPAGVFGLRPRRQAYVGAGLLTATALSPVLAILPQSELYKRVVEGVSHGQVPAQPLADDSRAPSASGTERLQPAVTRQAAGANNLPATMPPPPSPRDNTPVPVPATTANSSPLGVQANSSTPGRMRNPSADPVIADTTPQSPRDYNIRLGNVGFDITSRLSFEFNDNITSSGINREQDFVTTAGIDMDASWKITRFNSLDFGIGASMSKYVNNTDLDSYNNFLTLSPDTNITLNVQAGDVLFTAYERLAYSINPVDTRVPGAPTTSVDKYARFTNTAGLDASWKGKHLGVNAGVNRQDTLPQDENFDFTHSVRYNFPLGIDYQLAKNKSVGLGASYSIRKSKGETNGFSNNDTSMFSVQPTFDWEINPRLELSMGLGYSKVLADDSGTSGDTSEDGSMNGFLSLRHQPSKQYTHWLSISRGLDFGFTSNSITSTNVDYGFTWKLVRATALNGGLSYQKGSESVGESFDRYIGTLGVGYNINKKTSLSLNYSHTQKSSDQIGRSYHQNRLTFGVSYDF